MVWNEKDLTGCVFKKAAAKFCAEKLLVFDYQLRGKARNLVVVKCRISRAQFILNRLEALEMTNTPDCYIVSEGAQIFEWLLPSGFHLPVIGRERILGLASALKEPIGRQ
jgi:hypothetical protein